MDFKLLIQLDGETCSMRIDRLGQAVVLLRIEGNDVGEFGDAPMRCLEAVLPSAKPGSLFVDARQVRGVTMSVSAAWASWLTRRKDALVGIHLLASSRYVAVSAQFVRRFAELDGIMHVYDDPQRFDSRLLRESA